MAQAVATAEQFSGEVVAVHVSDMPAAAAFPMRTRAPSVAVMTIPLSLCIVHSPV